MGKALLINLLFLASTSIAQTGKTPLATHALSGRIGVGNSRYFSGFAATVNYQLALKRNVVSAGYQYLEEVAIFNGTLDHASELYLIYSYPLTQKNFALTIGTGISSVHNKIAFYKILEQYDTSYNSEGTLSSHVLEFR